MKKRYIFYIVLALGLAWLIYHRISENKKISGGGGAPGGAAGAKGGPGAGGPPMTVSGIVASYSSFNNALEITGSIEANESVALQSEVSGLVTSINFTEGSYVSKGKVLLKINDRDIQAQLQQARTKESLSATSESRARQLLQKGAISQEEYDIALADLNTNKAQTSLIRTQLARTVIVAPFSGKIGLRSISTGEYLTPTKVIANLLSTNPVKVNFSIPEKYMGQIKLGSAITFTTDGSTKVYNGKVFALEPGVNTTTRTLQIKALAQNPNNELLPGSFAKITLSLSKIEDAILVPNEAVIPVLKGKVVFVSRDGKALQVPIEAGTRTDANILVLSGIKKGDTVLTTGTMSLKDGAPVRVNISKLKD
ncbi:MAG: efflux RND transporter periplasmic adaptor subunit [Pedobacter sp.]|nr:MAG: efflux RND transporter periplasmic adaptor subunit [Pedobacter sp.]